jgi:hypothetical protein
MNWLVAGMKWIMLASGVLTCSMAYVALAPQAALRSTFGETLEGPLAEVVVRNWGGLITLVGGMLIYGAFHPPSRPLVLCVAGLGKLFFIGLLVAQGPRFLGQQAGLAAAVDLVMVVLFAGYLLVARGRSAEGG